MCSSFLPSVFVVTVLSFVSVCVRMGIGSLGNLHVVEKEDFGSMRLYVVRSQSWERRLGCVRVI